MNPGYCRANEGGRTSTVSKGSADTLVGVEMKNSKIGASSAQLYSQFIYRITGMGCNIAMFSKPNFMTSPSFKGLREYMTDKMKFEKGFVMDAAEFADVKSWPLTFTILSFQK